MKLIPLFVYGTLRIGEGNYRWASMDVVEEIPNVTIRGDLYFFSPRASFPVAKLDGQGAIKGDILFYEPDSRCFEDVCEMELHAGYEMRQTWAKVNGSMEPVVAWHYIHDPRGEKIEDGDWIRAASEIFQTR